MVASKRMSGRVSKPFEAADALQVLGQIVQPLDLVLIVPTVPLFRQHTALGFLVCSEPVFQILCERNGPSTSWLGLVSP